MIVDCLGCQVRDKEVEWLAFDEMVKKMPLDFGIGKLYSPDGRLLVFEWRYCHMS